MIGQGYANPKKIATTVNVPANDDELFDPFALLRISPRGLNATITAQVKVLANDQELFKDLNNRSLGKLQYRISQ
jgi:hypothetical protein